MEPTTIKAWSRRERWAHFVADAHLLSEVRSTIDTLRHRLKNRGYQFAFPQSTKLRPRSEVVSLVQELEKKLIFVPVAVQAFVEEVGQVDFAGTDPNWPFSGYHGLGSGPVIYPDAMQINFELSKIERRFGFWKQEVQHESFNDVGPFRVEFSGDACHKSNISGGAGYSVEMERPQVDPMVFVEWHGIRFVTYLRHALAWGGFPGFELIQDAPRDFLDELTAGLELTF